MPEQQQQPPLPDPLHYPQPENVYDEVYRGQGQVPEHWQYLLSRLQTMGPQALAERELKARRILRDDGATYNIASETPASRTWGLDPVPLLIGSEEWGEIEAGLQERSELLNLVLKDIYGKRDLIRHGLLPPELIYSDRNFLRPCHDALPRGEHQLILHSVDMVRGPDGAMCAIGDRTQAPSGAGYALENRTVMSRVLPSLFRDSHVHRLALFFQSLRHTLGVLAPSSDIPSVVILTPGAYNETYFEHTYLANYLGYPLVQGRDLTVREGHVWMKSLNGLSRVDVILRRVDDFYCDPVELKQDSHLGVPGLLQVIRAGRVAVANPLGSGVLENPALLKYLPQIGRFFLGREPRLASARTYWCGDPADMAFIETHFEQLVIKPVFRRPGSHSVLVGTLTPDQKAACLQNLKRRPFDFVAQEYRRPASSPTWQGGQLCARPVVLRSFAVASQGSYRVMPGGLTRVGPSLTTASVTNQSGSTSKDTWVLASEPEKIVSLRQENPNAGQPVREQQAQAQLPSRVVENLFWMGRYAERAEAAMRLLRTVFVQINAIDQLPAGARLLLLRAVTQLTQTYPGFSSENPEVLQSLLNNPEKELLAVILDRQRTGSVATSLQAMLNCSEEVKEQLSADTQRIINDLRDELYGLKEGLRQGLTSAPEEALDPLVTTLLAMAGLTQESMIRGIGWRFLEMGRRLEKALQTATLLRATLVPVLPDADQDVVLESVLLSSEALITYRRRYHNELNITHGLDLLMLDPDNPRSLIYQVDQLRKHFEELPAQTPEFRLASERRYVLEALTAIQLGDPQALASAEGQMAAGTRAGLDQLMSRLQLLLRSAATALSDKYFEHITGSQLLAPILREHGL